MKNKNTLRFINDRLHMVPCEQRNLGITFWPKRPEFKGREIVARLRAYSGREKEDKVFRVLWNLN